MNREWIDNMNRRNFIKISALVGTGFCLTPEGFTGNADDVLKPTAMLKGL